MTVSAGVAGYQQGMASHELLIAAADRALYQAKEKGRDRVELAAAPTPPPASPLKPEAPPPPTAAGRVLVVDDDRDVLRAVVKVLQAAGYTAEGTTSPQNAIARYKSGPDSFDLVVTDVLMPDITGMVMVDLLLGHKPDLRVVYMSGYVQKGGVTWAGLPGAVVGFVPKPIEMQELLNAVKEALTRPLPAAT
jgi:PleD family two-component response regulator